jgi:hypothetical protein
MKGDRNDHRNDKQYDIVEKLDVHSQVQSAHARSGATAGWTMDQVEFGKPCTPHGPVGVLYGQQR